MLIERCCAHCGQLFVYEKVTSPRIYCSTQCNWRSANKRRPPRKRAYDPRKRKPLTDEQRQRRRERERGKKRVRTPEQEARQKAAVAAWKAAHRGYRSPAERIKDEFRKHLKAGYRFVFVPCGDCGVLVKWAGRGSVRKRCLSCAKQHLREKHWTKGRVRACPCCGVQWCALKHSGQSKPGLACSDECRAESKRMAKRAQKRKRRHQVRGATVQRVRVFERDGWKCQACHCDTPQRLIGTHDDNAPELDHVVPLAAGGAHTYENTQCLCRLCNQLKSDQPMQAFINQWLRGGGVRAGASAQETGASPAYAVPRMEIQSFSDGG